MRVCAHTHTHTHTHTPHTHTHTHTQQIGQRPNHFVSLPPPHPLLAHPLTDQEVDAFLGLGWPTPCRSGSLHCGPAQSHSHNPLPFFFHSQCHFLKRKVNTEMMMLLLVVVVLVVCGGVVADEVGMRRIKIVDQPVGGTHAGGGGGGSSGSFGSSQGGASSWPELEGRVPKAKFRGPAEFQPLVSQCFSHSKARCSTKAQRQEVERKREVERERSREVERSRGRERGRERSRERQAHTH